MIWRIIYKFQSAYTLNELVSTISTSYAVQPMEFSDADSRFIDDLVGGGNTNARAFGLAFAHSLAVWDLGNGTFLALSSSGTTNVGVGTWLLALWNVNMWIENRKGYEAKLKEVFPRPKLD